MNLKDLNSSILHINRHDISSLSLFIMNSERMGDSTYTLTSNSNVEIATMNPNLYIYDIIEYIIDYVDYITKSTAFSLTTYENSEFRQMNYNCEFSRQLDTIEDVKDFLKEKGEFNLLILFSIVKYVDLVNLKPYFKITYKSIEDKIISRDKKLNYLKIK